MLPAQSFIRYLLEEDPKRRMTLTAALNHPWLRAYTPVYVHPPWASTSAIPAGDVSMLSTIAEDDGSFRSNSVNQDFENMQLVASTSGAPLKAEGSRAPLQRRSHVMSQAAEDCKPGLEPSWEMVAAAS